MKTKLKETSQSRLEVRDGILCVVVETALDGGASKAGSPDMRQWFRVAEPDADPAVVAGRRVRNLDPQEGLFVDEEGNSYRLAGGGQAKPDYAEVIPVNEGGGRRNLRRTQRSCRSSSMAGMECQQQAGGAEK